MALGVRFYGRGTARPQNQDLIDTGGATNNAPVSLFDRFVTTTNPSTVKANPSNAQFLANRTNTPIDTQDAITRSLLSRSSTSPSSTSPFPDQDELLKDLADIFNIQGLEQIIAGIGGGGGGGGDGGSSALSAKLADLAYQREKDRRDERRGAFGAAQSSQMIQDMLTALPTRFQGLADLISQTGKGNETYIQDQYRTALADLTARRDTGAGLQERGFSAARSALERMQPTAFESPALALPTAATNQIAQFLSARGVPQGQIQAEVAKVNQASQDAQTNYTGLLGTLRAIEQNAAQSRQVENNLAEAVAKAQLQTIYGSATSDLEQQRLKGLNDLFNQLQSQRFQLEQAKVAREDALNDSLAKLAQAGYPIRGANPPSDNTGGGGGGGGKGSNDQVNVPDTITPAQAIAELAALAPTNPDAPVDMMLRNTPSPAALLELMAIARQEPTYGQGGGGGIGAAMGPVAEMMAEGGVVTKPTLAMIGEDGPEAVIPLTKPKAAKKVTAEAKREMIRNKFLKLYGAQ